ncbi:hypothetical protein [Haloferula helveola]|uniref:hypothetical protein n=1 Tax=Haloferula helveola TaxID=490095 RepID=UPI0030CE5A7E
MNGRGQPFDSEREGLFFSRLFAALERRMGEAFARTTFVIHRRAFGEFKGKPIPLGQGDDDKVLIVISDEREVFPVDDYLSYRAVFRAYGFHDLLAPNVHSFPVSYFNAAGEAEPVPFGERETSVFFSGYMNRNRVDLFKQFCQIGWLPRRNLKGKYPKEAIRRMVSKFYRQRSFNDVWADAKIGFTEWFAKGLPPEEYARVLANSKIALCPPGFESHETIRHWEAMRLGCVIISGPLPNNRFYRGSPIIQIRDWSALLPLVADLLAQPDALEAIHRATTRWWDEVCSEEAVASYMAEILAGR